MCYWRWGEVCTTSRWSRSRSPPTRLLMMPSFAPSPGETVKTIYRTIKYTIYSTVPLKTHWSRSDGTRQVVARGEFSSPPFVLQVELLTFYLPNIDDVIARYRRYVASDTNDSGWSTWRWVTLWCARYDTLLYLSSKNFIVEKYHTWYGTPIDTRLHCTHTHTQIVSLSIVLAHLISLTHFHHSPSPPNFTVTVSATKLTTT